MNITETVISAIIIAALGVIGVLLCMGKCSFLLGTVRDMQQGTKRTLLTRIFGIVLLVVTVLLAIVVFLEKSSI